MEDTQVLISIFKANGPHSGKLQWATVSVNASKGNGTPEDSFTVTPGRDFSARTLPWEDYEREFAPSLPDNITQRIERALVACTPLHYDKMPRSNVKRVRGSLVQINIYVTC